MGMFMPIVGAAATKSTVAVTVEPQLRRDPRAMLRLSMMLSVVFATDDISERAEGGEHLRAYRQVNTDTDMSWATAEALNEALANLPEEPVLVVRHGSLDMTVLVAVRLGRHHRLMDYHAWRLAALLHRYGVEHVQLAPHSVYKGSVLELWVPLLDCQGGIGIGQIDAVVRDAFSFRLDAKADPDATAVIPRHR